MLRFIVLSIFILLGESLFSQWLQKPEYNLQLNTLPYYGHHTPFWFVANQQGKYLPHGYNSLAQIKLISAVKKDSNIGLGYGLDVINRYNRANKLYLNQAYLETKLYFAKVLIGSKHTTYGNQDSVLSSGGLLYSGNARPMPKIALKTDGYVDVPFTMGYLEFSSGLEHGWFENSRKGWMDTDRYGKQVYYHHKYLKGRIGGDLPVHGVWGFHHYAQWGGNFPGQDQALATDFESYMDVFMANSADSNSTHHTSDILNKSGNHIGGRMAGLEAQLKNMNINIYWQTIFEDGSGLKWQNVEDGLYGVSIRMHDTRQIISGLCFEYLHTTMQSGPVHDEDAGLRGDDNYFNNSVYRSGWTYYGFTLGNPFLTSPVYEEGQYYSLVNNKVIAHHYGFKGNFYKEIYYKLLFTFHENYGTNKNPYAIPKGHIATLLAVYFPINVWF